MLSVENTWKEIKDSGVDTAVVTFAAIEQHSRHLPLGTDWLIGQEMARRLAERLGAYLLPVMPFGCSIEHMAFPGTVTLRAATLGAVLEDIVTSLLHHGIVNVVVLSSHGGNWVLKPILRELNFKYPELNAVWATGPLADAGEALPEDVHAGRSETSIMMRIRPELVKEEYRHDDSPAMVGQEFLDYVGFERATQTGAWGHPGAATPENGGDLLDQRVERQARYVRWALQKVADLRRGPSCIDRAGEEPARGG